jgi:hypothetical protein
MTPFDVGPFGFGLANLMFTLVPVIVIGGILFVIGSAIFQAIHNSSQPLLTRRARVVGRRQQVSHHHHNDHLHTHTAYFVTFEFEDGSREEFSVRGDQYAMLVEGDVGTLQSQGTWFKGFDREPRAM